MPGKPNSLRTKISKIVLNNVRGIGEIFNQFPSNFKDSIAKSLYKVMKSPTLNMLSLDVLNFVLRLRTISFRKDKWWM